MSELKVETIKPAFGNKVTVSPGFLVTDSLEVSKFEITTQGTIAIMGPLYVGTSFSKSTGTAEQVLHSQGAGSPPIWGTGFPIGGIIMWSGTAALVPAGWAICNGQNGTPDLRDKFVVGVGTQFGNTLKASGGTKDAVVVSHTHTTQPHNHTLMVVYDTGQKSKSDGSKNWWRGQAGTTDSATVINDSAGESGVNKNLPPFVALYYIMKVS